MSAYLVEDETINRVVEWFCWEIEKSPFLKEKLEAALGIDTTTYQWFVQLGHAMFQLNVTGMVSRYGEGAAKRFRKRNYAYKPAHGSEIQVLKSLQCWLYQCTEGDVVKKPLYRFFREVVEPHLMRKIIGDLPEYEVAAWG